MVEIVIDLTAIQFLDSDRPLFDGKELLLSSKNFIFAKNGSGKSTLSNAIANQKNEEFDVQIFKGFDGIIGEKDNFDAFSLAVDAGEKEAEIRQLEKQLNQKRVERLQSEKKISKPIDEDENLFSKLEKSKASRVTQESKLDKFYTNSARDIANSTNPNLVKNARTYNKKSFKEEIKESKTKELLQDVEITQLHEILESSSYDITSPSFKNIDLLKYLTSVNEILSSKVEEHITIRRLDNQQKINFAENGLHIHDKGDVCSFCGNKISDEIFEELESYFSVDEVKILQDRIGKGKLAIQKQLETLETLQISARNFYPNLIDKAESEINDIERAKQSQKEFLDKLYSVLENKERNLFLESEILDIAVPNDIDFTQLNKLIEENNQFSSNLEVEKDKARKNLRLHKIKKILEDFQYDIEIAELNHLIAQQSERQKEFDNEENSFKVFSQEIDSLEKTIEGLKPKAEKQAIERINKKLRLKVSWQLDFYENEESGYYLVKEGNRTRSVKKLSTGEKNIIAFLYFIEKLEEIRENQDRKSKLIVFDDPMSSNDDTMQYLIICELQRLYQGKEQNKFDVNKDIIVILTHNVHFYLNVQPHGSFKDEKGRTKYDKNNFYRIDNHKFVQVLSEKEDFKTSYEALWIELKNLYECGHENSMLNSMRRIIETYMQFNCLKQEDFYRGNEQYLKLFNVHSHSIETYSAETFTENKEDMKKLFYQIFKDNGCENHFNKYWTIESK
ncbi:MAG: AAA family ATPase [Streptococcus sp.]|nr:AAA family ATPase [Streptococcus sp.]